MSRSKLAGLLASCCFVLNSAVAFQLAPVGTRHEVLDSNVSTSRVIAQAKLLRLTGIELFVDPVHETLTQIIFSCDHDWDDCADADLELAGPYVIAGVRWNDDPGFMLSEGEGERARCKVGESITFMRQTWCWIELFRDGESRSIVDPNEFMGPGRKSNLMTRSHFGDLQFLHSMAAMDGISSSKTRDKVMMWARFSWGIVLGEYQLNTDLGDIHIPGWEENFVRGPNVQDLLTIGRSSTRPHLDAVAFGTLLHLVQDSFSQSHVQRREPIASQRCNGGRHRQFGRIHSFSSYTQQDHKKHGFYDQVIAAKTHRSADPDVVDAGRILVDMYRRKAPWNEVETYLFDCVFPLENPDERSGPGVAAK